MTSRLVKRHLSLCLVLVMLLTAMLPVSVFAAGSNDEGSAASGGNAAATTMISDYATFLSCFKVLEGYAQTYAEENAGEDANALIINYIRTGVERYTDPPGPYRRRWPGGLRRSRRAESCAAHTKERMK